MLIGRPTITRLVEPMPNTACKRIKRSAANGHVTTEWRTPSGQTLITVHNMRGLLTAQVLGLDVTPVRYQIGEPK